MKEEIKGDTVHDQSTTHIVEIVHGRLATPGLLSALIVEAMKRIADRAVAAGMIVLSTTISTNTFVITLEEPIRHESWLTVTVICHWASRESLERQQRQSELLGQPGPRRMS